MFPALQTMVAGLTPEPASKQRAFAINFTLQNAALGVGTVIGAVVASVRHPGSFQVLFLANAASCLVFAAVLALLPNLRRPRVQSEPRSGYRDVLAHRGLRLVMVASLILAFTGYPAFDSGLPAYATVEGHVSAHIVALSLTVNTAVIVATQLIVLRFIRRVRRSRAPAVTGLILAVSWAVLGLAALPITAAGRIACAHMHVLQERMPAGQAERRHLHSAVEQLYYILDGVATVRFDDHEETLRSGDAGYVPAAAPHQLRNDSPEALEFLVISSSPPRRGRVDLDLT